MNLAIAVLATAALTTVTMLVLMCTLMDVRIPTAAFVMVWVVLACSVGTMVLSAGVVVRGI